MIAMAQKSSKPEIRVSDFQRHVLAFLKLVAKYGGAHLSCNQMIILGEVWIAYAEDRPLFAADVRELCNMPKATASRVIASLGDKGLGFISVRSDPSDNRRKLLQPSTPLIALNDRMSDEFHRQSEARGESGVVV